MRIPLDRRKEKPLYRQIQEFLRREILTGALPEDTKLPSTRKLATELGVSRITVNNAYAELEVEGLVYTRLGSGTFVAPNIEGTFRAREERATVDQWPVWQQSLGFASPLSFSEKSDRIGMLMDADEETISFTKGIGASELYPVKDFFRAVQDVMRQDKGEALGYGDTVGYLPLRKTISHILSSQGIPTYPENVLITSGSQQAIVLIANVLLRPGDTVLLESPTYPGAIMVFRSLGVRMVGIPLDEGGMIVEEAEDLIRKFHPSMIYTVPTFQNPTGTCLSTNRRHQLIQLAERYNVPIVEDEFVGDLRYEGQAKPALKALDPGGMVIYIGTFSKVLIPALRIGYIVASGPVFEYLEREKKRMDLASSTLIQRALEKYITVGRYEKHLNKAKRIYKERRDVMESAIQEHMPEGSSWFSPQGGLFLWLSLPGGLSTTRLYSLAGAEGVSYGPGALFYHDREDSPSMRLNFTLLPPEEIEEGVKRLSHAIDLLQERISRERGWG